MKIQATNGNKMHIFFRLKHHFFGAFRELFIHHHGSLEFRSKLFALVIAANEHSSAEQYMIVRKIGCDIYKEDEDRANLLMLTTKEKVKKVKDANGLDIDTLVASIQKDLRFVPRYAKKINIEELKTLLPLTQDKDTLAYQENILEFLQRLKEDTLETKKEEISNEEAKVISN